LLDEPLRILRFEENVMDNDFTKYLRQEIVKWTCTLNHPQRLITSYIIIFRILKNIRNIFL